MIIKVHVQNAHSSVNGRPGHDKRLAVNALTHDIERLARAADTWAFILMISPATPTTAIAAGVRREKNVFPRKLTYADCPHDVPNRDCANCIDRQRMYAIAEQCGTHKPRPTDNDIVWQG
jgi:hypothetical protein